jgi:NMT1 family protein
VGAGHQCQSWQQHEPKRRSRRRACRTAGAVAEERGDTRKLLDSGHAKGRAIRLESALQGLGIPLHAGAQKFYAEKGLIK